MKFILIYYSNAIDAGVDIGGAAVPPEQIDFEKLEAFVKASKKDAETAIFLRETEKFDGQVETHKDTLPLAVVLLGDAGDMADLVREAYEKVDVEVTEGDLDNPDAIGDVAASHESDGDRFGGNMGALKERAHDLGVTFSPTIGYNALLSKVLGKEKADELSRQGGAQ